jgi:hypothetical protein
MSSSIGAVFQSEDELEGERLKLIALTDVEFGLKFHPEDPLTFN